MIVEGGTPLSQNYSKATMAQPSPKSLWLPRAGPDGAAFGPPSHGVAVVLFFQLHQHSGETGGGPGVKGMFLKHGSGWWWGHPTAVHGLGWAAQTQLYAWLGMAQFSSAWLGWSGMHEPGGQRGGVAPSLGL
jgi:hypothetical protein